MPSVSMMLQNGQATATASTPVAMISSVRLTFTRWPSCSSMNMRPPPAPQQKPCCLLRAISTTFGTPTAAITSRGASNSRFQRPR